MAMTEAQEMLLRERYADEKNGVLAAELGVSVRRVERWAQRMGLRKSASFRRRCASEGGIEGKKVGLEKAWFKGDAPWRFKKGHRWDVELEEKRIRALQELAAEERRRMRRGEPTVTGWRMNRKNWISEKK